VHTHSKGNPFVTRAHTHAPSKTNIYRNPFSWHGGACGARPTASFFFLTSKEREIARRRPSK
jgi:hypothetical protein